MGGAHHHPHGPGHDHGARAAGSAAERTENRRRLTWALVLAASFMVAEAVGGWVSGSLALLADAGHMLSDVAALGLSLFALQMATKPADRRRTYGYHRVEILAALANGAVLVALSVWIVVEAIHRFQDPPEVAGGLMLAVAVGGLVVNLAALKVLHGAQQHSLNMRGAWLHVLTDALGSVQAIVAGVLVWGFGWTWADPVASVLIALLVVYSSWSLLRSAVAVLMEAAPEHIDVAEVHEEILAVDGVEGVHDLHVWTITSGHEALSAHVVSEELLPPTALVSEIRHSLHARFGIDHITIQVESESCEHGCAEPGEDRAGGGPA